MQWSCWRSQARCPGGQHLITSGAGGSGLLTFLGESHFVPGSAFQIEIQNSVQSWDADWKWFSLGSIFSKRKWDVNKLFFFFCKKSSGTMHPSILCWISIDISQTSHVAPGKYREWQLISYIVEWWGVGSWGCTVTQIWCVCMCMLDVCCVNTYSL